MRQVWWALRRQIHGVDTLDVEEARQNYRATLTAWNGGLNRLAALIQVHFGQPARECLESIREEFGELGFALDEMLKAHFRGELRQPSDVPALGMRFAILENDIYQANLLLLSVLDGAVPVQPAASGEAAARPLGLGMRGEPVRELQRKLTDRMPNGSPPTGCSAGRPSERYASSNASRGCGSTAWPMPRRWRPSADPMRRAGQPVSCRRTSSDTRLPSARSATLGVTAFITRPSCFGPVAPASAMASATNAASSGSPSWAGR